MPPIVSPPAAPVSPEAQKAAALASQRAGHRIVAEASVRVAPTLSAHQFRLANGLVILAACDARAPVFAYQSWYGVGSRHESPERTGLAHLFEHLMFKGTRRFATGTFDREMEARGAETNAATWVDWTYYTQALSLSGDNLATVIAFESDRMHNLVLDAKTFASELEVVKNERRMAVEDAVGGALSEALFALAFTEHSYRWPTIGSMAHLEAASLADLEAFYRQHYAPNNAAVVLCGGFDLTDALGQLAAAYGPLAPSGPRAQLSPAVEPVQRSARRVTLTRPVLMPQVVVGFVAPPVATPDHYAAQMLIDLLTDGDTARLHRQLVIESRLAVDVSGFVTPFADPGLIELHITAAGGADVAQILAALRATLDGLADGSQPIGADELDKVKNGLLLGHYDEIKDVEGLAEMLGHHHVCTGHFAAGLAAPEQVAAIGVDTLVAAAKQLFAATRQNVVVAQAASTTQDRAS